MYIIWTFVLLLFRFLGNIDLMIINMFAYIF